MITPFPLCDTGTQFYAKPCFRQQQNYKYGS